MTKKHVKNAHMGQHLLAQVYNVEVDKLTNPTEIANEMVKAVKAENLTLLNCFVHEFDPQGVTVNITLAESHFTVHTWPEKRCVAVDVFTCGNKNPRSVAWWMLNYFDSDDYEMNDYAR
tara:strand:+ start:374 stop:730 length:357 start_codon:yes stop_codon:yes gene_type:complete